MVGGLKNLPFITSATASMAMTIPTVPARMGSTSMFVL